MKIIITLVSDTNGEVRSETMGSFDSSASMLMSMARNHSLCPWCKEPVSQGMEFCNDTCIDNWRNAGKMTKETDIPF